MRWLLIAMLFLSGCEAYKCKTTSMEELIIVDGRNQWGQTNGDE